MVKSVRVIAVDGTSGSGKSTISKLIAEKLNLTYIDTGAMFRAIAYSLKSLGINFEEDNLSKLDQKKINDYLKALKFEYAPARDILIRIDGVDLTSKIREHEISKLASFTSRIPVVRDYLKKIQRHIGETKASLLDGRDIGTVVFPDAPLKFFITASPKVRAQRRYDQLISFNPQNKNNYTVSKIEEDIISRDKQDMERPIAPLKQAKDAVFIDTTSLSIAEVLNIIETHYKDKKHFFEDI